MAKLKTYLNVIGKRTVSAIIGEHEKDFHERMKKSDIEEASKFIEGIEKNISLAMQQLKHHYLGKLQILKSR